MKKSLFAFLILTAASANAELNKWVDQQGKVHYSDRPPAGVEATELRAAPAPANATAPSKSYAEREAELRKARQSQAETAENAAREQSRTDIEKSNCNAAQQALRSLQQAGRIVEYDERGERSFLGDNERQQRIAEAQANIERSCK